MLKTLICSFSFLCLASSVALSQGYPGSPDCAEPLAHKIGEFNYISVEDLKLRLRDLEDQLKKRGIEAKAAILVYGGRRSRSDEFQKLIDLTKKSLSFPPDRFWVTDSGFRNQSSIELFLLPMTCTFYPTAITDLDIDHVDLTDLPSKRLEANAIVRIISNEVEARCGPAARAVRACIEGTSVEVFVVIDKSGSVVFARSIKAHPLNRANAESTAKQFRFEPFKIGGVETQVSGTIKIVYSKPEEIVIAH